MLTAILTFIASPVGKIVSYIIGGISVVSALVIMLKIHDSSIKNQALLEFNQKQMEQIIKDQAELTKKMNDVKQIQDQILENEKQFKQNLDKKLSGINGFLNSDEAKKLDRSSSEILKRTIREIAQ